MLEILSKDQWILFFNNPVFLSAITSWLLSQLIKTIIALFGTSLKTPLDFIELVLWRTGGMPSSHSALVAALSTSIAVKHGLGSDLFIFSIFSAMIVVRDAVGVRRSSGIQAKTLNDLGSKFEKSHQEFEFKPVKEIQGHKPVEATAGIILGVIVAILFSYFGYL